MKTYFTRAKKGLNLSSTPKNGEFIEPKGNSKHL
jgi:hypothetical protein